MFINELLVVSILLLIFITRYQTYSLLLQPFYWNQTTFRPYQDGSLVFEVRLGDVMDLICPFYDEQQSYMTSELEQYDIFRVTENEYQNCKINLFGNDPMTRRVITCNSPYDIMKYTLNFRSYLPIPNGFEFRPNQTYYFLSTSSSHYQCNKLKILVHDYYRMSIPTTTLSFINDQERKPISFSHYSHHRHVSSSIDKNDHNDIHRPLLHAIKVQRHSDPYSIKWITEGPHRDMNIDKIYRTTNLMETSSSPSQMLSLALSSSSMKLSISYILLCLLLSLR
ncbi:unnamed protein product [Rotaria sp. Silwood1]|nr:unnamed protein product [Rotaria sp. Silwood1]CAF0832842.1 unnamed protein product [Rotaria sp. Silwood1]CAF0930728.1 unnamed protein product [Rotaria sp. Silwood1]